MASTIRVIGRSPYVGESALTLFDQKDAPVCNVFPARENKEPLF